MENIGLKIFEITFLKTKSEKVRARADVHFVGFTLKGFKIIHDEETGKNYITPPSYQAGVFWRPLFKTDSPEVWKEICDQILKDYEESLMKDSIEEL
jgi:hypothetical protein